MPITVEIFHPLPSQTLIKIAGMLYLTIPEACDLRGKLALALDAIQCPPPKETDDD